MNVALTLAESADIAAEAKARDLSVPRYLRVLALDALKRTGRSSARQAELARVAELADKFRAVTLELRMAGHALNRIVHAGNAGHPASRTEVEAVFAQLLQSVGKHVTLCDAVITGAGDSEPRPAGKEGKAEGRPRPGGRSRSSARK